MPERPGVIGEADGSTLFLDEIGELSTDLQAHLLRFLDARGEYQKLGDARRRTADVRCRRRHQPRRRGAGSTISRRACSSAST